MEFFCTYKFERLNSASRFLRKTLVYNLLPFFLLDSPNFSLHGQTLVLLFLQGWGTHRMESLFASLCFKMCQIFAAQTTRLLCSEQHLTNRVSTDRFNLKFAARRQSHILFVRNKVHSTFFLPSSFWLAKIEFCSKNSKNEANIAPCSVYFTARQKDVINLLVGSAAKI